MEQYCVCVLTICLKRTHDTSVRRAHKSKVRVILTCSTTEMTQVLSHSFQEQPAGLKIIVCMENSAFAHQLRALHIRTGRYTQWLCTSAFHYI